MENTTYFTLKEIRSQTHSWAEALGLLVTQSPGIGMLKPTNYHQILFIGCGSTYYLSLSAAAQMQICTNTISRGIPSSELLFYPNNYIVPGSGRALLIAISRSGTTTETLLAVEKFKRSNAGDIITITNYKDSPLSQLGDINLSIPSGREESIAQTRSFTSMFVMATALTALMGNDREHLSKMAGLVDLGDKLLCKYEDLAKKIGENHDVNQFFFLGNGRNYGLASEASLKLKEMALTVSEPFHFLEFRHGPKSMVNEKTMVIGLLSEDGYSNEIEVIKDIQLLGGKTLTLGESGADVNFDSGLPEQVRGVLYLPVLQLIASFRSISYGLNPDRPKNLTAVVEVNLKS